MSLRHAVRLLLVEPHQSVHAAVERLIERQKLPYVLETAASREEAVSRLRRARCDAVLLDGTNGNGRTWGLSEEAQRRPVILLVDRQSNGAAARAARRGACPCPVDPADEDSWTLLPAVLESMIVRTRRAEQQARQQLSQLAHMQRVSTISEMVGELAHELNQPLSAIADYARASGYQARTLRGEHRHEVIDYLGRIGEQAFRAGEIVRRVRGFVRRADCPRSAVELNELIRRLAVLLEVEARSRDVRLVLALGDELPKAVIDRVQIEQVITNLVRNAVEAAGQMPPPRRAVTIRTSLAMEADLEVAVEDKGPGLDAEEAERLFEPFHTSKAGGLGLGLWISRSIVEAHGGRLEAVPGAGEGTIVRFSLPVAGRGDQK